MSSWGCQSGGVSTKDCSTTPGAKFKHPIRFNVYRVADDNEAGRLVGAVTPHMRSRTGRAPTHQVPGLRPEVVLEAGQQLQERQGGQDHRRPRQPRPARQGDHLGRVQHQPLRVRADRRRSVRLDHGRCPYDSLNVGLGDGDTSTPLGEPTVGTQPSPDDAYLNSSWTGAYCDGSLGTGAFRLDAATTTPPAPGPATSRCSRSPRTAEPRRRRSRRTGPASAGLCLF